MSEELVAGRIRSMLDMKLTVGQVISGSFVTVTTVVVIVVWSYSTFETKADALKTERRVEKVEDAFAEDAKLRTEMYGDVREIKGILRGQTAEPRKQHD